MRAPWNVRSRFWAGITAVLLLAGTAGCADGDTPVTAPTQQPPVLDAPVHDERPRDDLHSEVVVHWEEAEIVGEHQIRVTFWTGNAQCYGVRSVVQETDTEIAIAIVGGVLPQTPDECTEEARHAAMTITTQQPVADRQIVRLTSPNLTQ